MRIADAIPSVWRQIITQSKQHLPSYIDDIIYFRMEDFEVIYQMFRPNGFTMNLKVRSKFLQLLKNDLKKSSHSLTLTGRKYTPCLSQSRLKLRSENFNTRY